MRFQRLLQLPLFFLFLFLLWLAAYPLPAWFEVDLFLRLDPLISLGSLAVARDFIPKAAVAFVVLGLALFLGRFFCGYICPMGATLDAGEKVFSCRKKRRSRVRPLTRGSMCIFCPNPTGLAASGSTTGFKGSFWTPFPG